MKIGTTRIARGLSAVLAAALLGGGGVGATHIHNVSLVYHDYWDVSYGKLVGRVSVLSLGRVSVVWTIDPLTR